MRSLAVLDASVAVRWVLQVPGRSSAREVLVSYQENALDLAAPSLQRFEVGSALWKYYRAGLIDRQTLDTAYEEYLENAPMLVDSPELGRLALSLAALHDRSVYDCAYLALSLELGCELLTADKKLFRALGRVFPQIQLIGD